MGVALGGFLLGTRRGARLRSWYQDVFGAADAEHGALRFGDVLLAIDERPDVSISSLEPTRLSITFCVADLANTTARLDALGARWFDRHTVVDPDGNCVHLRSLASNAVE